MEEPAVAFRLYELAPVIPTAVEEPAVAFRLYELAPVIPTVVEEPAVAFRLYELAPVIPTAVEEPAVAFRLYELAPVIPTAVEEPAVAFREPPGDLNPSILPNTLSSRPYRTNPPLPFSNPKPQRFPKGTPKIAQGAVRTSGRNPGIHTQSNPQSRRDDRNQTRRTRRCFSLASTKPCHSDRSGGTCSCLSRTSRRPESLHIA